MNEIILKGCNENNLKNIDVKIPYGKIVAFIGVSGSGKSSIVFDTLYSEGKRRYIESLSVNESYFLSKTKKPKVDFISGLPPAIAIKQNNYIKNPRSTVGTISQAGYFIQLLFATCGEYKGQIGQMKASAFSLNSPKGVCDNCEGIGKILDFDETLIWPNQDLSVMEGGLKLGGAKKGTNKMNFFNAFLGQYGYSVETPINELSNEVKVALLYGQKKNKKYKVEFPGIISSNEEIYRKTKSLNTREEIESFMAESTCTECGGTGYNPASLRVQVKGINIAQMMELSLEELLVFLRELEFEDFRGQLFLEFKEKLFKILINCTELGIGYLSLGRKAASLSGGEMQRVVIVSQISNQLSGVVYVLDEPSSGMHASDIGKLIKSIAKLNSEGNKNTVVIVEHNGALINMADYIIEIGPGAGILGGELIAKGTPKEIIYNKNSITGAYLSNKCIAGTPNQSENFEIEECLEVFGAHANNLKDVNVKIPLNCIVSITGVSGCGKSSLVFNSIYQSTFYRRNINLKELKNLNKVNRVVFSDQSPVGKTSRSTVATYSGVLNHIRELFANTDDAKKKKYTEAYFSYNLQAGQCDECKGEGEVRVEMSFMPDMYVYCESCQGTRYKEKILNVMYKGKNVHDVLDMRVEYALSFFKDNNIIKRKLRPIFDVGLGYLKLGQPTSTLSGGESQRLKLAKEIAKGNEKGTLYIFDEPSSGLHFKDVELLLKVLKMLIVKGNSIILVEHNMDLIASSDYIIDLGLGGGVEGGNVVGVGTPKNISFQNTPTGEALKKYFNKES